MSQTEQSPDGRSLVIAGEAVSGEGEDAFSARTDALGGLLCVADGCGGIGSRRYEKLERRTGAYLASRLAARCAESWVGGLDGADFPAGAEDARAAAASLEARLRSALTAFEREHGEADESRIVVSMQRKLPTTLCLALIDARRADALSCLFLWAGDSRGYMLTEEGLRQCTADHVVGGGDALESLYHDSRLSNMVCADRYFRLESRAVTARKPCAVILATDGAFSYLPTPMEFELLLLNTLRDAHSLAGWRKRLHTAVGKVASDDATLLIGCFGYPSFEAMQRALAPRRDELQRRFVTPVRRRRQSVDFARERWKEYRREYEANGEDAHADRRV